MKRTNISSAVLVLLLLSLASGNFGCQRETAEQPDYSSDVEIKYGTSFGMCQGYCIKSYVFNERTITFTQKGWRNDVSPITCTEPMAAQDWKEIVVKIDMDQYKHLRDTIGCPDCADGGTEWIEVYNGSSRQKIVFEYKNEPEELKSLLTEVRAVAEAFSCDQ